MNEYLRCEGCGVQLPIVSTPVGPCEDCGGELVVIVELPREIVHFAGPALQVGNVVRQRCLWCGGLIEERDLERTAIALEPGETEEEAAAKLRTLSPPGLVAVNGNVRWAIEEPADGKVPERACSELLPAES